MKEWLAMGVDWSKDFIDVCFLTNADMPAFEKRFDLTATGFSSLRKTIDRFQKLGQIRVGIETEHHIVVNFFTRLNLDVYVINPRKVHRFKEIYNLAGQKDDRRDAYSIALMLRREVQHIKPLTEVSGACQNLRVLLSYRDSFAEDKRRATNRFRASLQAYFPAFSACFDEFSNAGLELFKILKTPSAVLNLSCSDFLKTTQCIKRITNQRKTKIYEILKNVSPVAYESFHEMGALMLCDQIQYLNVKLRELEKEIDGIQQAHPLSKVFESVPGCGALLSSKLIAELGDNTERFPNRGALQAFAGTSPVTVQSGKSRLVSSRNACNKSLKNIFYQLAFCSITTETWARSHYDQLRQRGKPHSVAIRALSNTWAKIIFAMWKSRECYTSEKFLKKRVA